MVFLHAEKSSWGLAWNWVYSVGIKIIEENAMKITHDSRKDERVRIHALLKYASLPGREPLQAKNILDVSAGGLSFLAIRN